MDDPDAARAARLTATLDALGGRAGNIALRRALGWDADDYAHVRAQLVAAGALTPFRAHGGGIALGPRAECANPGSERALYQPLAATLRGAWAAGNGYADAQVLVEVTAAQGGRATGGQWTRPDLVLVALRAYPYVPGKHLDVVTFEVKQARTLDVAAVYEALAHRRTATHAILWVHAPLDANLDAIAREAHRHGIGLIAATAPSDVATWRTLVKATRAAPPPHDLNEFLSLQLGPEARAKLGRWLR